MYEELDLNHEALRNIGNRVYAGTPRPLPHTPLL